MRKTSISTDAHTVTATALEDSQVCVIPFEELEDLSRQFNDLQRQFHKIMSREIVRDHGVMLLLGSMKAEERLAAFKEAGVTVLSVNPVGPDAVKTIETLKEMIS